MSWALLLAELPWVALVQVGEVDTGPLGPSGYLPDWLYHLGI